MAYAIEYAPVRALKPYARNARTHSKRQIEQIARSIERFGFTNPVLVDDDLTIIAGHGRVEAAKLLGLDSVPILRLSHLSEADKRAYIVADNRLAELAGWDKEILAIELQGMIDLNFEVELTGFATAEIDLILDEAAEANPSSNRDPADELPAPPNEAVTRPGSLRTGQRFGARNTGVVVPTDVIHPGLRKPVKPRASDHRLCRCQQQRSALEF